MNTVLGEGPAWGWAGAARCARVGRELFCKIFRGCPRGDPNLTIMDKEIRWTYNKRLR